MREGRGTVLNFLWANTVSQLPPPTPTTPPPPLLLPKHFSIIQRGLGQEVTEVDLEYIWAKKQMRLVYLSTSHRRLSLFLCSGPQRCQLRLPADKKEKTPSAPISLTARRRGYEESESEGLVASLRTDHEYIQRGGEMTTTQLLWEHFVLPSYM